MGAVLVADAIHDAFMHGPEAAIELFHGYTYSGHPLACAASIATLDTYAEEHLFHARSRLDRSGKTRCTACAGCRTIDIRNVGLIGAIELAPRDGAPGARGYEVFERCFHDGGLLVRVTGDVIALSPPLIVTPEQIGQIVETLGKILRSIA